MAQSSWAVHMHTKPRFLYEHLAIISLLVPACAALHSAAEELSSFIVLDHGEQLTANEVEYVITGGDADEAFDNIDAKMRLAGTDLLPLYMEILQVSPNSRAVAGALYGLLRMGGDPALYTDAVNEVIARGDMLKAPDVRGALIRIIGELHLESHTEMLQLFLEDQNALIRIEAFRALAKLGDQGMLIFLEEIAPRLREQEMEEMEGRFEHLQVMLVEAGLDVEEIRAKEQKLIESRHRAIQTAVQELRQRTIDEPEQESAPAETAVPPTARMEQSEKRARSDVMASQPEVRLDSAEEPKDSSVDESDPGPLPGSVLWAVVLLVTVFSIWLLLALRRRRVE